MESLSQKLCIQHLESHCIVLQQVKAVIYLLVTINSFVHLCSLFTTPGLGGARSPVTTRVSSATPSTPATGRLATMMSSSQILS